MNDKLIFSAHISGAVGSVSAHSYGCYKVYWINLRSLEQKIKVEIQWSSY